MTNLEEFLKKDNSQKKITNTFDIAEGSFKCQNLECDEVLNEAGMDREKNRIFWTCKLGHESSVII